MGQLDFLEKGKMVILKFCDAVLVKPTLDLDYPRNFTQDRHWFQLKNVEEWESYGT